MDIYQELHKFNNILYQDSSHKYLLAGVDCISGTKFIKRFTEEFDSHGMAVKYAAKHNMSVEEVLNIWDIKRDISTIKGTHVHSYAEYRYMNKIYETSFNDALERFNGDPDYVEELIIKPYNKCIEHFNKFYEDSRKSLIPIKSEVVVGDPDLLICGMLDQLFWNVKMKEYQIWDWKTSKAINKFSIYKKRLLDPISNLHDCEYNKYSLQLSLYKYIIEKNTNIKIGNCYLVHITEQKDAYEVIPTKYMKREIDAMITSYKLAA